MLGQMMTLCINEAYLTMDAAVASDGNDNEDILMVQHAHPGSPNHQIAKFQVFVFRYSGSVVRYGHSYLGIQAQYSGLCLGTHIQYHIQVVMSGIHIQVFRFRIKNWVYRLVDKYKVLTFSIHIQFRIWVRY